MKITAKIYPITISNKRNTKKWFTPFSQTQEDKLKFDYFKYH